MMTKKETLRKEITKPFCIECDNKGYFTNVVSIGLNENHPYLKPHIERCDACKVYKNDQLEVA